MLKNRFAVAAITVAALTLIPAAGAAASGCDPLDTRSCILPFPSNFNTVAQKGSDTGLRLNFSASQFPNNVKGKSGFPPELNRNDGFSPGSALLTYVPGIDMVATGAAPITDIAQYSKANAPIVVIDAKTGQRQPIWVELDANADAVGEPQGQLLMIHPAKNFLEGHTYIVALRDLKNSAGKAIAAGAAFASLRSGKPAASVKSRSSSYEKIFKALTKAKISRSSLYLAWDFTIASERNLSERALSMRNRSFAALGDSNLADGKVAGKAPAYKIDKVEDYSTGQSTRIARQVTGHVTVPCFLTKGCATGGTMSYAKSKTGKFDSIPNQQGTMQALFICRIPRAAMTTPARPSLYGHGLLGSPDEIDAGNVDDMASEHNMMFCATPEIGMADEDVPNAIALLGDMSKFASFPDRLQQGMLNGLMLGRAMLHTQGFAADKAFQNDAGQPMINTAKVFYNGNSQGGIQGPAITALAPDFTRAVFGVPGINYSLLLPRSVDFDEYELIFKPAYPSRLTRQILLNVAQNLWDRGEGNGYALHTTDDPLPNTPKHQVLLEAVVGDHQVAQVAAQNLARTVGAIGRLPGTDANRTYDKVQLYGIRSSGPASGSHYVLFDSGPIRTVGGKVIGTDVPPVGDIAPHLGQDPHGLFDIKRGDQASAFFNGTFLDVCPAGRACRLDSWAY